MEQLLKERMEIEEEYAKSLREFVFQNWTKMNEEEKRLTTEQRSMIRTYLEENATYATSREQVYQDLLNNNSSKVNNKINPSKRRGSKTSLKKIARNQKKEKGEAKPMIASKKKYSISEIGGDDDVECGSDDVFDDSETGSMARVVRYHKLPLEDHELEKTIQNGGLTEGVRPILETGSATSDSEKISSTEEGSDAIQTNGDVEIESSSDLSSQSSSKKDDTPADSVEEDIYQNIGKFRPIQLQQIATKTSFEKIYQNSGHPTIRILQASGPRSIEEAESQDDLHGDMKRSDIPERPLTPTPSGGEDEFSDDFRCVVLYGFEGREGEGELKVEEGEEVVVLEEDGGSGWTRVMRVAEEGYVPTSYIQWM